MASRNGLRLAVLLVCYSSLYAEQKFHPNLTDLPLRFEILGSFPEPVKDPLATTTPRPEPLCHFKFEEFTNADGTSYFKVNGQKVNPKVCMGPMGDTDCFKLSMSKYEPIVSI